MTRWIIFNPYVEEAVTEVTEQNMKCTCKTKW